MSYNTPYKKGDIYISNRTEVVYYGLDDVKIKNIIPTGNKNYYFNLYMNDIESIEFVDKKEIESCQTLKTSNSVWFKNNLDNDSIHELWSPCFNKQSNEFEAIYLYNNQPIITYDNIEMKNIDEFLEKYNNKIEGSLIIYVRLVCMHITEKSFSNKWIIRKIIYNSFINTISKEDIGELYTEDVNNLKKTISDKIIKLESKIEKLKKTKVELKSIFNKFSTNEIFLKEFVEYVDNIRNETFFSK